MKLRSRKALVRMFMGEKKRGGKGLRRLTLTPYHPRHREHVLTGAQMLTAPVASAALWQMRSKISTQ